MSPLILVGVLLLTIIIPLNADVKHVLDGSAHPPHCKCDQVQYHQQPQPQQSHVPSETNAVPNSFPPWWMNSDSPFKHAYDHFKKCSGNGNCITPAVPNYQTQSPPVQNQRKPVEFESRFAALEPIKKNPFLNAQVPLLPGNNNCRGTYCGFPNSNHIATSTQAPPPPPSTPQVNNFDKNKNPFFNKPVFSASGQSVNNGFSGFLGVQPNVPFNNIQNPRPFSQPQNRPIENDKFENCQNKEYVCVPADACLNGVVQIYGQKLLNLQTTADFCEVGKEVCCRLPNLSTTNSVDSYTASKTNFGFANLSEYTTGKNSIGSNIQFSGNAGLSPGSIQVITDDEPKPLASANQNVFAPSNGHKVIRNTTPNSLFGGTVDYSNEKFDRFNRFDSQFAGPQYLPPVEPSISTYQPSIPTYKPTIATYKPSIPTYKPSFATFKPSIQTYQPSFSTNTYRPIPSASVISVQTNPPFQISTPKPFEFTQRTQPPAPVTIYRPSPKPTVNNGYLPPRTTAQQVFTFPPRPTTPRYVAPSSTPIPQPSETVSRVTPGYHYPTPTPAFEYPTTTRRTYTPAQTVTISKYAPPSYLPPKPTVYVPPPTKRTTLYVPPTTTTTTRRTTVYVPPKVTPGYYYERPSPPFDAESNNINNNYIKITTPRPVTNGYSYPTPSPSFTYPSPIPETSNTVTHRYVPPVTSTTSGYDYPSPSPSFTYTPIRTPPPTRAPTYIPPTRAPTYIPPLRPDESNPPPSYVTTRKPFEYIPPAETNINNQYVHATCAAALKCVPEQYCTAGGLISQTTVTLTKEQAAFRVPLTNCFDKETKTAGLCCRDPNYVDPWPSANNLNGNDDGQYREDPSLGQYVPDKSLKQQQQFAPQQRVIRSRTKVNSGNFVSSDSRRNSVAAAAAPVESTCGIRLADTTPRGRGPIDVNFAEIPWQAMILRDTNRSLLCGGAIIKPNAVLTAAHCVEGLETNDVLIKGGEWRLGIDAEPLPFQIVKVGAIIRHPEYEHATLKGDLALLMLEENLKIAKNIAPICLPSPTQPAPTKCIVTGWGKRILQVHLRNAIMRSIEVNVLDNEQCKDAITNKYPHVLQNYSPNTICGFSDNDQCDVDYGSAIACTNGDDQYTLAGIFNWDTGCKDASQIGAYTPPDMQWIDSTCSKSLNELKSLDRQYRNQHQ